MNIDGLRRGSQSPHPRSKFTAEEDERLLKLVEQHGSEQWQQISRAMPGRNSRQCRDRWTNFLSPDIKKSPWVEQEEGLLFRKIAELGNSWKKIASFFPGRSEVSVKSHWQLMQRRAEREVIQAAQMKLLGQKTAAQQREEPPIDLEILSFTEDRYDEIDFETWFKL
jgi:hypothetical protein